MLRAAGGRTWRWFTLDNVSRLADLAAKLAAIVVAFVAINFFSAKPNVQIAQVRCRSAVDLRLVGQLFKTIGGSTLPRLRTFAARFPTEPNSIFGSGIRGAITVGGDPTVANCRRLFLPRKSLPTQDERDIVQTYFLPDDVIPGDIYRAAFRGDFSIDETSDVPLILHATYTRADLTIVNQGGGTATNINVTSPTFEMRGQSFRLRSGEQRTVSATTKPYTFGYRNSALQVRWDAERSLNTHLLDILLLVFGVLLIAVFLRDLLTPEAHSA